MYTVHISKDWEPQLSNGVKQGGILSPLFFNIYMDDLSRNLNNTGVGCYVNNNIVNHIMYADDVFTSSKCQSAANFNR